MHEADILQMETIKRDTRSGGDGPNYQINYTVGFMYDGIYLKKLLKGTTIYGKVPKDHLCIYYNPKYPDIVVMKGVDAEISGLILIAIGVVVYFVF